MIVVCSIPRIIDIDPVLQTTHFPTQVCQVQYGMWPFRKDVSAEMLKLGLASIYRQSGAVYGDKLQTYEKLEAKAQEAKKGARSSPLVKIQSPQYFRG